MNEDLSPDILLDIKMPELELEFKNFLKATNIPDGIKFEKYCDIDFDERTNLFASTTHPEDKNHDIQPPSDSTDKMLSKNDEKKLVSHEECMNIIEKVNGYISQTNNFSIERKKRFVLLRNSLNNLNKKKEGIRAYLIKRD